MRLLIGVIALLVLFYCVHRWTKSQKELEDEFVREWLSAEEGDERQD